MDVQLRSRETRLPSLDCRSSASLLNSEFSICEMFAPGQVLHAKRAKFVHKAPTCVPRHLRDSCMPVSSWKVLVWRPLCPIKKKELAQDDLLHVTLAFKYVRHKKKN